MAHSQFATTYRTRATCPSACTTPTGRSGQVTPRGRCRAGPVRGQTTLRRPSGRGILLHHGRRRQENQSEGCGYEIRRLRDTHVTAAKGERRRAGSYYAAKLGQPEQSPYCFSRGGFAQFESLRTDTSATGLTYQLPYLDPCRVYKLCAILYHEGDSTWSAALRCDSGPWHSVRVAPNVPDTFWLQVPKALYKNDARIVLDVARVTGGYVSLARLKLYQIEEQPGDDGGVQSWGSGITYVTRLRGCSPNPFARGTSVNYELAQYRVS